MHNRQNGRTAADESSGDPSATARHASEATTKKRRGAQLGNSNAVTHGCYSQRMLEGQSRAKVERDRHKDWARQVGCEILKSLGLEDDPIAKLTARQLERLEAVASRFESHLDHRGYFRRDGEVKAAVRGYVDTVDRLLGEARRLLERLGSLERDRGPTLTELILEATRRDARDKKEAQGNEDR